MATFLPMPDISKKITPVLLLPPEVIWNLSRLSKHLMLSWTSSEEGDHASISLMFDKTQPSKHSSRVASVLPTLPSLTTTRVQEESPFSEIIAMNMDEVRGSTDRPVTPVRPKLQTTKPEKPVRVKQEPGIMITQEAFSLVVPPKVKTTVPVSLPQTRAKTPLASNVSAPNKAVQVEQTETRRQELPNELSRVNATKVLEARSTSQNTTVTKLKSSQELGTKERIDALLKSCRSQTDRLAAPPNPQNLQPVQTSTPIQEQSQKPPSSLAKPFSSNTTVLTEPAPNTPGKRSYKKVVAKKPAYHREAASIKATVYQKDSRKRKVFRKTPLRPSKRRSLTYKLDTDMSDENGSDYEIGSSAASQRHDSRGKDKRSDIKNIMTVKECMLKIRNHISYRHLSRANHRDVWYEICDEQTSFHLKCYKNGKNDPFVYKDITLQWLERNALQIPVYIMQQCALRLLYKFLKGRPANDAVPHKERDLLLSLI